MRFIDVDINGSIVALCGNYGDPIYHHDLPKLVANLKSRGARISLITNGSHRKNEWWKDLCREMDNDDKITFSIDGLPTTFTQYRENADWESIEQAIKICVESGVKTIWKYIPFKFNQSDIDSAESLSKSLGMSEFNLEYSDRFDDFTKHLIPDQNFLGAKWVTKQIIERRVPDKIEVSPKCHQGKMHFITADGYYSSCCFVSDHRFYYKTIWGKNKKGYDIKNTSLKKILSQHEVSEFYQNVLSNPPLVCQYNCPRTD